MAVVPNCLRGHATAGEVADAITAGVTAAAPGVPVLTLPLADGGDGTLDALAAALPCRRRTTAVVDAHGRTIEADWLLLADGSAVVESAAVCGLGAALPHELDPLQATSAGVGQIIAAVVATGVRRVLLGLGGTAVVDGGAGALAALGARFRTGTGEEVFPLPGALASVTAVDLEPARRLLAGVELRLLPDVGPALADNIGSFGAQKGVTDRTRPVAVAALARLADLLDARERFHEPWFGAGGGIGFGVAAVAKTVAVPGAQSLLGLTDRDGRVGSAALAITAEGVVDRTTWLGKLPGTVAGRRAVAGLPTAIVAARFTGPLPHELVSAHPLADPEPADPVTGQALLDGLAAAGAAAVARWTTTRTGADA